MELAQIAYQNGQTEYFRQNNIVFFGKNEKIDSIRTVYAVYPALGKKVVIPAKAGNQGIAVHAARLDSGVRRNDGSDSRAIWDTL
ncbi:MAG: hypothetical protein FWG73_00090 [Planctomycetaceae bacterium]|nr:hypothetical protein [Planctomycetaceae bacterium]